MRVCLVVPLSSELSIPAEIQAVSNTFSAAGHVVHVAEASRHGLRDALNASPFDMAWFAGHCAADGFELADGVWRPAEVGRWLVAVRAWMFVANACFSSEHVLVVQQIANVDIVATIAPAGVEDGEAAETALYLARALIESNDLAEATRRASANGQLQYRFFPSGAMAEQARAGNMAQQDDVAALVRSLKGDPFTGAPGLLEQVSRLAISVAALTATLEASQARTDARLSALEDQRRPPSSQVAMTPRMFMFVASLAILLVAALFLVLLRLGGA